MNLTGNIESKVLTASLSGISLTGNISARNLICNVDAYEAGGGPTPPTYEPETEILCAEGRYTTAPSTALKDLINTTIKGLKDDGVFAKGDCLYFRNVHEELFACQNWIKNAHNSTLVNTPEFTPKIGFKGNGLTSYIDNNYNPYSDALNFGLNSATIAWMCPALGTNNERYILGTLTGGAPATYIIAYFKTAANEVMFMNEKTLTGNNNVAMSAGSYISYSKINNGIQGYLNGYVSGGVDTVTTADRISIYDMFEFCGSHNTGPFVFYNGSLAFSFYGGALNDAESLALYTRAKYFTDNVGGTF